MGHAKHGLTDLGQVIQLEAAALTHVQKHRASSSVILHPKDCLLTASISLSNLMIGMVLPFLMEFQIFLDLRFYMFVFIMYPLYIIIYYKNYFHIGI